MKGLIRRTRAHIKQLRLKQPQVAFKTGCPFCGSDNLTTLRESEALMARTGCLDCDRWFTPERKRDDNSAGR